MKLLLTSGGVSNTTIHDALGELLAKPISDCDALCIPTAEYGHPMCTPASARRFVTGESAHMCGLGWRSVGLLELTALPTMDTQRWIPWVRAADALLVDGGDAGYLAYWMRRSGLVDLLPSLTDTVWIGISAGSMVLTPCVGDEFTEWTPPDRGDAGALGLVDFSIFPHLDHDEMPDNTVANARRWAAAIGGPAYAIDDQTAISVVDGDVEIISDGAWHRLGP
jgi:dipeptidase E